MINLECVSSFLRELGYSDIEISVLIEQIKHFDEEADNRDVIVEEYLNNSCINKIVDEIVSPINFYFKHKRDLAILDIGVGSGIFTAKIRDRLIDLDFQPNIYGLDISPRMLKVLSRKNIIGIWGVADKIPESIALNSRYFGLNIPSKFDVAVSILAFHHFHDPEAVLKSVRSILQGHGLLIIIDILRYEFDVLKRELKDIHPGFTIREIISYAKNIFPIVDARIINEVHCRVSNYRIGLFKAILRTC